MLLLVMPNDHCWACPVTTAHPLLSRLGHRQVLVSSAHHHGADSRMLELLQSPWPGVHTANQRCTSRGSHPGHGHWLQCWGAQVQQFSRHVRYYFPWELMSAYLTLRNARFRIQCNCQRQTQKGGEGASLQEGIADIEQLNKVVPCEVVDGMPLRDEAEEGGGPSVTVWPTTNKARPGLLAPTQAQLARMKKIKAQQVRTYKAQKGPMKAGKAVIKPLQIRKANRRQSPPRSSPASLDTKPFIEQSTDREEIEERTAANLAGFMPILTVKEHEGNQPGHPQSIPTFSYTDSKDLDDGRHTSAPSESVTSNNGPSTPQRTTPLISMTASTPILALLLSIEHGFVVPLRRLDWGWNFTLPCWRAWCCQWWKRGRSKHPAKR